MMPCISIVLIPPFPFPPSQLKRGGEKEKNNHIKKRGTNKPDKHRIKNLKERIRQKTPPIKQRGNSVIYKVSSSSAVKGIAAIKSAEEYFSSIKGFLVIVNPIIKPQRSRSLM